MMRNLFKKAPQGPRIIPLPAGLLEDHPQYSHVNAYSKPENKRPKQKFAVNIVSNRKYSIIGLVPMVVFDQFKYFFNLYFLLVSCSQFIPQLQVGEKLAYFGPLIMVVAATAIKEALEDLKRRRRDKESNSQPCNVLDFATGGSKVVPSSALCVGDIITLQKDQRVPADLLFLRSSDKNGTCFIRTDQLDGETDWKLRLALPNTQSLPKNGDLCSLRGHVDAEPPSISIYTFAGSFRDDTSPDAMPIGCENMLWMNTVLASDSIMGLVVYTGRDTRAVMNTEKPKVKFGLLDSEINNLTKILFFFTIIVSGFMAGFTKIGDANILALYLFRFVILFSSIIPINLRVNLEVGKIFFSYFISHDKEIPNTIVRTSTIPEELGRINFLLTDKTGTLTKNEMELKKLHTGTMSFNTETFDEVRELIQNSFRSSRKIDPRSFSPAAAAQLPRDALGTSSVIDNSATTGNSTFTTEKMKRRTPQRGIGRGPGSLGNRVHDLLLAIAICHNVSPIPVSEGSKAHSTISHMDDDGDSSDLRGNNSTNISYQAASPDEISLVKWAHSMKVSLIEREIKEMKLLIADNFVVRVEILHVFPFTSESKRMGIIVRDMETREIVFYEKGADSVMSSIVVYNDWLLEECDNMAREGLRTLVIARKRLSEEMYETIDKELIRAKNSFLRRNEEVSAVVLRYLECEMELLGLTGVEDKLQDDVRPTLESLRNAGIRIWMLTGDKFETAKSIALSAKLTPRKMPFCPISSEKIRSAEDAMNAIKGYKGITEGCLIVDGGALAICLDHCLEEFLDLATRLTTVVCCRCSPTQKTQITKLIRKHSKQRVAAIGDGGNDVGMICAANVGIGIMGKEGKQASLASDFSVTQFSHISRLLLWHGRTSYKRSAKMSQLIIHRGLIISVMQAVFSSVFYFSPIGLYQGYLLLGYTTFYTNFAMFFCSVYDYDVTPEIALMYPELYKDLVRGKYLSQKTFCWWLLISVFQGYAIMIVALFLFESDFRHIISISFTALIFNELIMVAVEIVTWQRFMFLMHLLSLGFYVLSWTFVDELDVKFMMTSGFWWKVAVITAISGLPLWIIKKAKQTFSPPSYQKLINHH